MTDLERVRSDLAEAMFGAESPLAAADALCSACVEQLGVGGAAISYLHGGASAGTFGSSGGVSRLLDELEFTYGEGPSEEAARTRAPVLVADLADPAHRRWPAYTEAAVEAGVRAVFAFPVVVAAAGVGALELFRTAAGPLAESVLDGAVVAAELAAVALLDLMTANAAWQQTDHGGDRWAELASLERVEVYQATGMLVAALQVGPAEALARLRGHAFAHNATASEVAFTIIDRQLTLEPDNGWVPPSAGSRSDP